MISMTVRGNTLANGTGFIVEHGGLPYLVTNAHNLTGRHRETGEILSSRGAMPDAVMITHNSSYGLGTWVVSTEPLYDTDERPLWLEHPKHGSQVDVVALPITQTHNATMIPHSLEPADLGDETRIDLGVTSDLHVVGFPFAISSGGFTAIWTRGSVATELDIDFEEMPCFLIDARTRTGQSGSPVVFYTRPGATAAFEGGGAGMLAGNVCQLMGVYSGRINKESDLGYVWRVDALREILDRGVRPLEN